MQRIRSVTVCMAMSALMLLSTAPAATPQEDPAPPTWDGTATPLPHKLRQRMTGVSWRPSCPVHLDDLRLLRMPYWGFDGEVHRGRMVVNVKQANKVLRVFRHLYREGFPIRRMRLVEAYDGDDQRVMAANNTSAFNCRTIAGSTRWSEHAYGRAIDVNPIQNPYVRGATVQPGAGRRYLDRSHVRRGMITRPGPVVAAFEAVAWRWGGDWSSSKDYQHFSRTGR